MKIKKGLALAAGIYALVCLGIALAVLTTGGSASAGKHDPAGKSNISHLYLYEKDPSTWEIVDGGMWGKMKFNRSGENFEYVFNGHGLVPEGDYTLIYYPDPWPGTGLKCLGSGLANEDGNVHIMNSFATGELPMETDDNYPEGAKIWLVKSSDVACEGATWSVVGTWEWLVLNTYAHDLVITSQDLNGAFTGTGGYPAGSYPYTDPGQTPENITNGQVVGNQISFTTAYIGPYNPGYSVTVMGTINPDGTITGTSPWEWHSTAGNAVSTGGKMIGWHPTEYLFEHNLIQFIDTDD